MEWYISIPNHQQMVVLFKYGDKDGDGVAHNGGGWLLFEHKFPSYIVIDPKEESLKCDAPIIKCGELDTFDKESMEHMYHVIDGHRYGVYMAKGFRFEYIEPRLWNKIPPVDYRNVMPFMLQVNVR